MPELKKILEFITTEGNDRKWTECEFSVGAIIESHHCNSWADITVERLECLLEYMPKYAEQEFWTNLDECGIMRNPKKMPPEELFALLKLICKPKKESDE